MTADKAEISMDSTIQRCTCVKCEHTWFPRKTERPVKCPRCQCFAWDGKRPHPKSEAARPDGLKRTAA